MRVLNAIQDIMRLLIFFLSNYNFVLNLIQNLFRRNIKQSVVYAESVLSFPSPTTDFIVATLAMRAVNARPAMTNYCHKRHDNCVCGAAVSV